MCCDMLRSTVCLEDGHFTSVDMSGNLSEPTFVICLPDHHCLGISVSISRDLALCRGGCAAKAPRMVSRFGANNDELLSYQHPHPRSPPSCLEPSLHMLRRRHTNTTAQDRTPTSAESSDGRHPSSSRATTSFELISLPHSTTNSRTSTAH